MSESNHEDPLEQEASMARAQQADVANLQDDEVETGAPADYELAVNRLRQIADDQRETAVSLRVIGGEVEAEDSPGDRPAPEMAIDHAAVRIVEAQLFAAPSPVSAKKLAQSLDDDSDIDAILAHLEATYADRGINLVRVAGKWSFRTAEDLSYLLEKHAVEQRRLSKAALETLSIIAYHQPVTRAEIEAVRGVTISKGTLDVLMETNWVRPRGRRRAPGKPVTYGTTEEFLSHFGLDTLGDLPGLSDLKGAGLLSSDLPPDFAMPGPKDVAGLMPDELPLEDDEAEDPQAELDIDDEADDVAEEAGETLEDRTE